MYLGYLFHYWMNQNFWKNLLNDSKTNILTLTGVTMLKLKCQIILSKGDLLYFEHSLYIRVDIQTITFYLSTSVIILKEIIVA